MLRIRLRRVGKKKQPMYRIVVADSRKPRDGAFVENLGHYHPMDEPSTIVLADGVMGDVLTLVEKAQDAIGEDEVERLEKKLRTNSLDLEDFIIQIKQIKRMGSMSQIVEMIPGLSSVKSQLKLGEVDDEFWKKAEAVVSSMTVQERRHPEVINGSRRRRIAAGSGSTPQEVNRLLNQWKEAKKLAEAVATGRGPDLLKMIRR